MVKLLKLALIRLLVLILGSSMAFCNHNKNNTFQTEFISYNEISPPVPIELVTSDDKQENFALSKIGQYLMENKLDSFFVTAIIYPDSLAQRSKEVGEYIGVEIIHARTLDYLVNLEKENNCQNGDFIERKPSSIIPPITGNFSDKDRTIYYYFKKDSIANVLSQ